MDRNHYNIRHHGHPLLHQELAWFATENDNVLGVVILDIPDQDFSWVLLTENEQGPGFTAIDLDTSLPSREAATKALHDAMKAWPVLQGWVYRQRASLIEYDMGPTSILPDLRELTFDEVIDAVVDWFFDNFTDPVHDTPYDSEEGGYLYLWGGPHDAREEIYDAFGDAISEAAVEAAVERIERDGLEWVPSQSRIIAVAPSPSDK